MSQNTPNPTRTDDSARCGLHHPERNNYFTGKLLTPRDFITEQAYHAGAQRTLARSVLGRGAICGLRVEPTLHPIDGKPERLDVTVSAGLAVDGCGRLVVVDEPETESFPLRDDGSGQIAAGDDESGEVTDVSVYAAWAQCATESVPRTGMENACETECEPNRLVEYGELSFELGEPASDEGTVGGVDFPDRDAVLGIRRGGVTDVGVALDAVPVVFPPTEGGRVAGTTTAPVGEHVRVELAFLDDDRNPVETEELPDATVGDDGRFGVDVDPSGREGGTRVDVEVSVGGAVLRAPGVVGDRVEEPFVDDPTVLLEAARSYYAEHRRDSSFADGRVLLGSLHKGDTSWADAVFERGPTVHGNDELYAAIVSHAADFDNPHQVSLALEAVPPEEREETDGGVSENDDPEVDPLVSGDPYPQGRLLEGSVAERRDEMGDEQYALYTVEAGSVGNPVRTLTVDEETGTFRIETANLGVGPYVVTVGGRESAVAFDDGEATYDRVPADDVSEALFAVTEPEEPEPEPEPAPRRTARTRVSVAGFDGPGGDVSFTSSDGSVTLTPHIGTRTIDLRTETDSGSVGGLTSEERRYVRERSLLNAAESFQSVGLEATDLYDQFGDRLDEFKRGLLTGLVAPCLRVRVATTESLNDDAHSEPSTFVDAFTRDVSIGREGPTTLVDVEEELGAFLVERVGSDHSLAGLDLYVEATGALRSAVDVADDDEGSAAAVALAHDRVAEAVELLVVAAAMAVQPEGDGRTVGRPAFEARRVYEHRPARAAYLEGLEFHEEMPELVGLRRDEAEIRLAVRGIEPSVSLVAREEMETAGIGINDVGGQSPPPGERIHPDTEVVLEAVATPPQTAVEGVGERFGAALESAGITDVVGVATAPIERLVEVTGASEERAHDWKLDAARLIDGYQLTRVADIEPEVAETLVRTLNVTGEAELAAVDEETVVSAVRTAHEEGVIPQSSVSRIEAVDWSSALEDARERIGPTLGANLNLVGGGVRFRPR